MMYLKTLWLAVSLQYFLRGYKKDRCTRKKELSPRSNAVIALFILLEELKRNILNYNNH